MSDEDVLVEWGFEFKTMQADEGAKAALNLEVAVKACNEKDKYDNEKRMSIAQAISTWSMMTGNETRLKPMIAAIPTFLSGIEDILKSPNDTEVEAKDYGDKGLQAIACELAHTMESLSSLCGEFGEAAWQPIIDLLGRVSDVELKAPSNFKPHGPGVSRKDCLQYLLRTGPAWGSKCAPPKNLVDVVSKFIVKDGLLATEASTSIQKALQADGSILNDKMGVVFGCIRAGDNSLVNVLTSNATTAYGSDKKSFEDNIDLLFTLDFMYTSSIFYTMASGGSGKALGAHTEAFIEKLETGTMMDTMVVMVLNSIAEASVEDVFPHMDRIYKCSINKPNCDTTLAMFLGHCGKSSQPGASAKVIDMLGKMLSEPSLSAHTPPIILSSISNQFSGLGDGNTAPLTPYMDKIRSYENSAQVVVEKIVDWYEGRSLKKTDERVDALEAKVAAMNEDFAATCHNMEEVSALMDKKIADLKDFVGEIAKKLPQPTKLVVVGGVRKTLVLHFACARSGETVTTETKDWDQWCKVGFGLIKLGKCAAVAAAGNPMALAGGVGAIQDIYNGYKAKDDKDFNTFISQPFLTSAESDKLILQLRSGGFFSKMEYDAQLGDWVLIGTLNKEEMAKRDKKKAAVAATASNQEKQKGKNFGLGTFDKGAVADVLTAASDTATMVGAAQTATGTTNSNVDTGLALETTAAAQSMNIPGAVNMTKSISSGGGGGGGASSPASGGTTSDSGSSSSSNGISSPKAAYTKHATPKKSSMFGSIFGSKKSDESARIDALEARVQQLEALVSDLMNSK